MLDYVQKQKNDNFKLFIKIHPFRFVRQNYRLINLTNVFCKTLERLIRGKIMSHLESNNLSTVQSGFRTKHSTLTQLTNAQAYISSNLNKLNCVDGV